MNKTLLKIKNIGIPLVILLIVLLGAIYLLTQQNQQTVSNSDSTKIDYPQTSEAAGIRVIPVENLKQVTVSTSNITFGDSYIVNTIMETGAFGGITCGNTDNQNSKCIINLITDSKDTYYLSTPFEPIADAQINVSGTETKEFESQVGRFSLKYTKLNMTNESGELVSDQTRIVQVYGCAQNGICVGSGVLPLATSEDNTAAVTKFEQFLGSLALK